MADPSQFVKHIELYVSSSASPSQQAVSVDAIATLLKNDTLTLETLVREMDMYLTTTDNIIRSRGILLLGELLMRLTLKPLSSTAIHSLMGFFTERLADWKALRGALVGCLALMRRKSDVGMVSDREAIAVAQSYMQNLQVQSLGQHDRKLCFELLECLLDCHPAAVLALGDQLLYTICEGIDEEKDPQCLMHSFHIVEVAAQLYPDPSGPFADYAADLFEILGCYFPVHFTHVMPKGEDFDVNSDELSRALLLAFASTPLFEPFAIPLLLDKLSSSLPSTKVESLKYLSYCSSKYGSDRMAKHAGVIWSSLKDVLYTSPESTLAMESESMGDMVFKEGDVMSQSLILLQELTRQNSDLFLNLILGDEEMNVFINSLSQLKDVDDISMQRKQRLHALGRLLSVLAMTSFACCNRVFEKIFPNLMEALGLSFENPSDNNCLNEDGISPTTFNFGALHLCVELLDASRYLVISLEGHSFIPDCAHETWCCMLHGFCRSLNRLFFSCCKAAVTTDTENIFLQTGVRGFQILATFPGSFPPVPASLYEDILLKLVSVLASHFDKTFLWKLVLKTLVEIGFFIAKHHEPEKAASFEDIVVQKIVSLMSSDSSTLPVPLKVEAVSDVGQTGQRNMLRVVQGMKRTISANFTQACINGNLMSVDLIIKLLECYCNKVLPWFENNGGAEEVSLAFVDTILDKIESSMSFGLIIENNELLSATMSAMKQAVACCSEEIQKNIVGKAFRLLLSSTFFQLKDSISVTDLSKSEGSNHIHNFERVSGKDEWVISLFASVVIALRPHTPVSDVEMILQLFTTALLRGHVSSAQALGSLVNKLPLKLNAMDFSQESCLEDALDMIFNSDIGKLCKINDVKNCSVVGDDSEMSLSTLSLAGANHESIQNFAISGLAWIGKGLVMRGHEKVKDITMTLLRFLLPNANTGSFPHLDDPMEGHNEQEMFSSMKSAADAFSILMSDSEACLNRKFHAVMRPLYKQRFYNTMVPILSSLVMKSGSPINRSMLARSFAHMVSETPLSAILNDAKKLIPLLLDCLSTLTEDILNKDLIYDVILVMSGILMDKKGQDAVVENAHIIINQLIILASYSQMMIVRETALQCLVAMSELPHARIYPFRTQVLRTTSKALDDPKRAVRQEAVRCRQAWGSIASGSLHF